jgi:porphobilinogen synthase
MAFPQTRLHRLRAHPQLRRLVQETTLSVDNLIYPLFITHGADIKNPISSMPGLYQWSVDRLHEELNDIKTLKIPAVLLFGIPPHKDASGSYAYDDNGVVQQALRLIKQTCPELLVIIDICCCEYTDHGHCGIMEHRGAQMQLNHDATLELLQKQALSFARAGADVLAPSGMIDGMVGAMRQALDENGFSHTPLMSYAVKYASSFYGPFREAAQGAPQYGDRKSYQMNPANSREALREASEDIAEGADFIMVKPGLPYLDVIYRLRQEYPEMPMAAYQVSGEYAMIKAAAERGWINESLVMYESMLALRRAGADCIISYFAKDLARYLLSQTQ